MLKKILSLFLVFQLIFPFTTHAEDLDIPYGVRIPYKIVRGVTNIALGWTEMLLRPIGHMGEEGPLEAVGTGFINASVRFNSGLTDIATFWVPDIEMLELYPDWEGWPYLFHWS